MLADATAVDRGLTWAQTAAYGEWSERFVSRDAHGGHRHRRHRLLTVPAARGPGPRAPRSRPTTAGRCRWTRSSPRCSAWCATATASTRPTPSCARPSYELGIDVARAAVARPRHQRPAGAAGRVVHGLAGAGRPRPWWSPTARCTSSATPRRPAARPAATGRPTRRLGRAAPADAHRLAGRHHRPGARPSPPTDVRRARFGPAIGGLWWRLTLSCAATAAWCCAGGGDGLEEEAEVKEWLGDRVETVVDALDLAQRSGRERSRRSGTRASAPRAGIRYRPRAHAADGAARASRGVCGALLPVSPRSAPAGRGRRAAGRAASTNTRRRRRSRSVEAGSIATPIVATAVGAGSPTPGLGSSTSASRVVRRTARVNRRRRAQRTGRRVPAAHATS